MIIVVYGLPGTGKSSVAGAIGDLLNLPVINSDRIRREIGLTGKYSRDAKDKVYEVMFHRADEWLQRSVSVVLDATFQHRSHRQESVEMAEKSGHDSFFILVRCPAEIVRERMLKRKKNPGESEADFRVYRMVEKAFDPPTGEYEVLDTDLEHQWRSQLDMILNRFRVRDTRRRIIDPVAERLNLRQISTHISWILLDGRHVLKIKKPVRLSFLDYSTLQARRNHCHSELRINRRLAPEIYLDVVPITLNGPQVEIDGSGPVVDHAVKMVEIAQKYRMDHMLESGQLTSQHVGKIAEKLADFHRTADIAPPEFGTPDRIMSDFDPVFSRTARIKEILDDPESLDRIDRSIHRFPERHRHLFMERITDRRIRHCHGDVRAKNIFIRKDTIVIFDAVEFNLAIAFCDVAAEVAFLSMDLCYHGRPEWAESLVEAYVKSSGDRSLRRLIDFYRCYRALVRSMVASYRVDDPVMNRAKRASARREVNLYMELAGQFAGRLDSVPER